MFSCYTKLSRLFEKKQGRGGGCPDVVGYLVFLNLSAPDWGLEEDSFLKKPDVHLILLGF